MERDREEDELPQLQNTLSQHMWKKRKSKGDAHIRV
jgi:hypothetical protein